MFNAGILVWLFLIQILTLSTIDQWWPSLQRDLPFLADVSTSHGLFVFALINAFLLLAILLDDVIGFFCVLMRAAKRMARN